MKPVANFARSLAVGSCLFGVGAGVVVFAAQAGGSVPASEAEAAVPSAPSGSDLARCLSFSKLVQFKVGTPKWTPLSQNSKPLWATAYSAEKQLYSMYFVEAHKARSLFGKRRSEIEKVIEELERKHKSYRGPLPRSTGVDSRPSGRKAYFTVLGLGPGGSVAVVFTTIGAYDIALTCVNSYDPDTPEAQKIKNPAVPRNKLPEAFRLLEKLIPNLPKEQ